MLLAVPEHRRWAKIHLQELEPSAARFILISYFHLWDSILNS